MITTVTLNPAVDKTYRTELFLRGQVNRMRTAADLAGGKGINVTKVLRTYGFEVRAMGFLGGYTGQFIRQYAESIGAVCDFTPIGQATRCSINVLSEDGYVTELLEPGPEISGEELSAFYTQYEKAVEDSELMILSGSVPRGVPEEIYAELIRIAQRAGKRVLLDTSGAWLKKGAESCPFMIKPNGKELELLADRRLKSRREAAEAAVALSRRGIKHIMVSLGDKGLVYVRGDKVLFAPAPKVRAVNTVGCGDSVVASFAMSLLLGEDEELTLKRAAAISAANASTAESAVVPVPFAEKLLSEIKTEQWKN